MNNLTRSTCLILVCLVYVICFQNCGGTASAPADQAILAPSNPITALTTAPTPAGTPLPTDTALSVNLSSNQVLGGQPVTLTVSGGTPPYQYNLAKGAGKLTSNTYQTTFVSELAVIQVIDAMMEAVNVSIPVVAVSNPAYTILPNGTAVVRNCGPGVTLESFATGPQNVNALIAYDYCLVLSRAATSSEISMQAGRINSGGDSPYNILQLLVQTSEFSTTYGVAQNTDSQNQQVVFNLLLFRNPTVTELANYTTDGYTSFGPVLGTALQIMDEVSDWNTVQPQEVKANNQYFAAVGG